MYGIFFSIKYFFHSQFESLSISFEIDFYSKNTNEKAAEKKYERITKNVQMKTENEKKREEKNINNQFKWFRILLFNTMMD